MHFAVWVSFDLAAVGAESAGVVINLVTERDRTLMDKLDRA